MFAGILSDCHSKQPDLFVSKLDTTSSSLTPLSLGLGLGFFFFLNLGVGAEGRGGLYEWREDIAQWHSANLTD